MPKKAILPQYQEIKDSVNKMSYLLLLDGFQEKELKIRNEKSIKILRLFLDHYSKLVKEATHVLFIIEHNRNFPESESARKTAQDYFTKVAQLKDATYETINRIERMN